MISVQQFINLTNLSIDHAISCHQVPLQYYKIDMSSFLLCILAITACYASDFSGALQEMFVRQKFPSEWSLLEKASHKDTIRAIIALKQNNLDSLEAKFKAVSDPDSPEYGHYLDISAINAIIAPEPSHVLQVLHWLDSNGITAEKIKFLGDAIMTEMSVETASKMFQTTFHRFQNSKGRQIVRQMGSYSVPIEIIPFIDFVSGISEFPMPRPDAKKGVSEPEVVVVPQTISSLYKIPSDVVGHGVSQSVAEFQNDSAFSKSDLKEFFSEANITASQVPHVVGPFDGQYPDTEATLDIQYITGVGVLADNWYWTEENWMYDFSVQFFNSKTVPEVVSMSWGWSEQAQCSIDTKCSTLGIQSEDYVRRTNTEFMKIGLRGISLIVSSGDSGANGRTNPECDHPSLFAVFPGSSPYVTSVGATQFQKAIPFDTPVSKICKQKACAESGVEEAVSTTVAGFTSGGGFSTYSVTPEWQKDVVSDYLSSSETLPPSSYFNASGRGYPDLSAIGNAFQIYEFGQISSVGGTSASAPTIAGIISILNHVRRQHGQPVLGFLNPFLYKMQSEMPATFTDILSGDNICTEYGCFSNCKGFTAQKGWDPVTGLGTPNVEAMITYIKSQKVSTI